MKCGFSFVVKSCWIYLNIASSWIGWIRQNLWFPTSQMIWKSACFKRAYQLSPLSKLGHSLRRWQGRRCQRTAANTNIGCFDPICIVCKLCSTKFTMGLEDRDELRIQEGHTKSSWCRWELSKVLSQRTSIAGITNDSVMLQGLWCQDGRLLWAPLVGPVIPSWSFASPRDLFQHSWARG